MGVDTPACVLAQGRRVFTFICVIEAARTFVTRRTGTCVFAAGESAALSIVGTWTRETAVLVLAACSCPSYRALTLVLVKRQQRTATLVLTGVVWVTRGVLGSLAVRSSKTKRAGAGGTTRYRHTK